MATHLDLDDVAAQSPLAQQQLAALRAKVEALRADAEWKLTAESLPENGRLVLFEVDAKTPSRLKDYDGQVFACRYFAEASCYSSGFGVPGIVFHASRWRYVDPPPAIAAQRGKESEV